MATNDINPTNALTAGALALNHALELHSPDKTLDPETASALKDMERKLAEFLDEVRYEGYDELRALGDSVHDNACLALKICEMTDLHERPGAETNLADLRDKSAELVEALADFCGVDLEQA